MYPVIIRIGPLAIHTYGLLIAMGFLLAIWLAVRQAKKTAVSHEKIIDLGFYCLIAALIGSRLFFVLTNWSIYADNLIDVVKIWEGGLVFYGGLLFAIPTAVWYTRRKRLELWQTVDIFAPSIAIGHAIGRLGCFSAGCCYGKPAEWIPWSVTFRNPDSLAPIGVPLHPTQLYESAGEFLNFLILIVMRRHQAFKGQLFWMYILNYSIIRFIVERFRGDEARGFILPDFSYAQGISIIMFVTAILFIIRLKKRQNLRL